MSKTLTVGNRTIGDKNVFIIAEIGVTCNYDMDITKELISAAAKAGADSVKFVLHFPDDLMSDPTVEYTYDTVRGKVTENMFEMFDSLRFTLDEWKEIKAYADKENILLFASIEGQAGLDYAKELNFLLYKVGAWDLSDYPLWEKMSKLKEPIIIDVGTVYEDELKIVLDILKDNDVILLHDYHTPHHEEMNMLSIPYMKEQLGVRVGFSSPDSYDINDYLAIGLGARVIEKRLTLSHGLPGHHHIISKEPHEFAEWVGHIRNIEKSLGKMDIIPSAADLAHRKEYFKHICASEDIRAGEVITTEMLTCKRPEDAGLDPSHYTNLLGTVAGRDITRNEAVGYADVLPPEDTVR
jgi:sialic acid synthase SpsE